MPLSDAKLYAADDSGILVKPHPDSHVERADRLWFKSHHNFSINLKGSGLNELSSRFKDNLALQITNKRKELGEDDLTELPDLFDFIKSETFRASTVAFCGPHILELNPTLAEDFWEFDSWLPLIFKKFPRWIIPRAFAIRDKMHSNIAKWHQYANANFDRDDQNQANLQWEPNFGARVMRAEWQMHQDANVNISTAGRAAADLGLIWA